MIFSTRGSNNFLLLNLLAFFMHHTNSDSKIAPRGYPGDKEEATETYILVRRGDDDEVNEVI